MEINTWKMNQDELYSPMMTPKKMIKGRKLWRDNMEHPTFRNINFLTPIYPARIKTNSFDDSCEDHEISHSTSFGSGDASFDKENFDNTVIENPMSLKVPAKNSSNCNDSSITKAFENFTLSNNDQGNLDIKCIKPSTNYCNKYFAKPLQNENISLKKENVSTELLHEKCMKNERNQSTSIKLPSTIVTPFSFEEREKYKKQRREERANTLLEEERSFNIFNNNNSFIKPVYGTSKPFIKSPVNKKAKEIWKRNPFVPQLPKKIIIVPKIPDLFSTIRAKQRERFDESIKMKELEREKRRNMEMLAAKRKEEMEINILRKSLVHKAQPIRKYKEVPLPKKRPLTEPQTPNLSGLKRQRRF
ncbi:uncharacterized protein [Prorops nasuta]|uniref:uncharacterized protein n=1 Tax=Prorops nasuta TaxID=863751 RepID=UPI0034CFB6B8